METIQLKTCQLVFDERYQMRADLPNINEYCELLDGSPDKWPFDKPITVVKIGAKYKVVEGFTRGRAAKHIKRPTVSAVVIDGTHEDALNLAFAANARHGYRRTNNDKRKAVMRAMGEYPEMSAGRIARLCRVSATYIYNIKRELSGGQEDEPNPGPQDNAIIELDPCPVCASNDWEERDDGKFCAVCRHPYGESAGDSEEFEASAAQAASRRRVKPGSGKTSTNRTERPTEAVSGPQAGPASLPMQSATTQAHDSQSAPNPGRMVNTSVNRRKQINTTIGQLVRLLEDEGLLPQATTAIETIKAILKQKRRA